MVQSILHHVLFFSPWRFKTHELWLGMANNEDSPQAKDQGHNRRDLIVHQATTSEGWTGIALRSLSTVHCPECNNWGIACFWTVMWTVARVVGWMSVVRIIARTSLRIAVWHAEHTYWVHWGGGGAMWMGTPGAGWYTGHRTVEWFAGCWLICCVLDHPLSDLPSAGRPAE